MTLSNSKRIDDRQPDELRPLNFLRGWAKNAEGSCLLEWGDTKVLCTATLESHVPPWMRGRGSGWLTAEYAMLPRSSGKRIPRDISKGKPDGRSVEIQRLIGRSLRAAIDLEALGERMIMVDCDVLQADGGTRCASITAAWVAVYEALAALQKSGALRTHPLKRNLTAVSVGLVDSELLLDLNYAEDSRASLDMNVVMSNDDRLVEVQAGAEGQTFSREQLNGLLELATPGIQLLRAMQEAAIADL
ncbi:MAG: ribonuclease [Abditibacteriota bacterium]|nr:ribonuclease [Abditibacteriota bacterium]